VINERMARRLLPGEDPIGRRDPLRIAVAPWVTIVGVIGDVRHSGLEDEPAPEMYTWAVQNPPTNPFIVVRSSVDAASLTSAVRGVVQSVDKQIAAYDIRPMAQVRAESVAQRRFVLLARRRLRRPGAADGGGRRLRGDGARRQRANGRDRDPASRSAPRRRTCFAP
jgi:hypothetical protein